MSRAPRLLSLLTLIVLGGCLLMNVVNANDAYRLSEDVVPETYKLELLTDLEPTSNFTFVGSIMIKLRIVNPVSEIKLHQKGLNIKKEELTLKSSLAKTAIPVRSVESKNNFDFLVIKLGQALEKNQNYDLRITFDGKLMKNLNGYYRSSYVNKASGQTEWLAVTQFEPYYARQAFPCFDEPAMKANFTIVLGHHKNYIAASNMPLKETRPIDGLKDWIWDEFEESVRMSSYLVAYMISKFKYLESDPSLSPGTKFRVWAPAHLINQAKLASEVGPKVLSYFEEFFNVSYPLPKQDMVVVPDFAAGAMENWGFITYRETALLYDPSAGSLKNKERVAEVISHELAHQWFGNLVTMKWWSDLWLNEGFATYVASLGVDHVYPDWNVMEYTDVQCFQLVLNLDGLKSSHSISVPIGEPSEIKQIFDTISYKKGSLLLRMMNKFLGVETFRQGIHDYLVTHQYGNAEQDDLWAALTEEAHRKHLLTQEMTVKTIMDTWTKQTGYPILTVVRNYDNNSAEISQARFLSSSNDLTESESKTKWWVPLTFVTKSSNLDYSAIKHKEWLSPNNDVSEFQLPSGAQNSWMLLNSDMMALMRINYDQQNWDLIVNTLLNPSEYIQIPKMNRVQILFDLMAFARTGLLNYSTPLKVLSYLNHEEEHLPLKVALSGLEHVSGLMARTADYGVFEKFGRKIMLPQYKKSKELYDKRKPDDNEIIKKHITVNGWACKVKLPECEDTAIQLFDQWMADSDPDQNNPIPSELRTQTYCIAIARGSVKHWAFLWRRYQLSTVATHKISILQGLACTRIIWLNRRYLDWSLKDGSEIRSQDARIVFSAVASSDTGYFVAKSFLYSRIKDIYEAVPDKDKVADYISVIGRQALDKDDYDQFVKFVADNKQYLEGSRLKVEQTLETADINRKWRDNNYEYVVNLLRDLSN